MDHMITASQPICNIGHTAEFERRRKDLLQTLHALVRSGFRSEMLEEVEATASAMRQIVELGHA